ncbi:HK97 family phage prohead protease [Verrucosispora sp. WMMD703]|uniref:HK97 family phage prohead protease n=1 Tax=Verrucosispora sp. WMMD703 TaxID=3403463 RepID=UPI003B931AD0
MILDESELRLTAEHEAAHAVVADALGFLVGEVTVTDDGCGNTRFWADGDRVDTAAVYSAGMVWISAFRWQQWPGRGEIGCRSDYRNLAAVDDFYYRQAVRRAQSILSERADDVMAFADHLEANGSALWEDWRRSRAGIDISGPAGSRSITAPHTTSRAAAAVARAQAMRGVGTAASLRGAPGRMVRDAAGMGQGTAQRKAAFPAHLRADLIERDGKKWHRVEGYATVFERAYDMWDAYGPYEEVVAVGAATATLAGNPDVVFLVNHGGLTMARTTAGTLELSADERGLKDTAYLNPDRQDVRDLMLAIGDGVITEQSFAFRITEGWWNDDFTQFKIVSFDIDRGDVSAVNYGANPHTQIGARQQQRVTGRSVAYWKAIFDLEGAA